MKPYLKFMLTAGLLAVAFTSAAHAVTTATIRITGSSAYRGAVTNAILNLMTPGSAQAAYVGTSLSGANQQLIEGPLVTTTGGAGYLIVKTSWTGSLSALVVLTTGANTVNPFLSTSNATASASAGPSTFGAGATGGNSVSPGTFDAAQTADIGMSDAFQGSTSFSSPALTGATVSGQPQQSDVGVVPFVWVSNPDASTNITNINSIQAQSLIGGGLQLSQFTGNTSDASTTVLCVGRDIDSGTRFTGFVEAGYSIIGLTNPPASQYAVTTTGSGTGITAVSVDSYPTDTLFGTVYDRGTQGYSSGSGVAGGLSAHGTLSLPASAPVGDPYPDPADYYAGPCLLIGYVGESDGSTAVKNGGHFLSYNGVSYGSISGSTVTYNRNLVDQGVYTYWGYEHMYFPSGSAYSAIANAIAVQIASGDALVSGELLSNMKVKRAAEGAPIAHL